MFCGLSQANLGAIQALIYVGVSDVSLDVEAGFERSLDGLVATDFTSVKQTDK